MDTTSNDYLGMARRVVSRETTTRGITGGRAGAGASRLVQGTAPEHEALESAVAAWVGLPAALLFSSGFAANQGVVSALAGVPGAAIVSDALNHASLIDGARLSRANVSVVPHRDVAAVDAALAGHRGATSRWVVTESYFSMDGDRANLEALRALCDRHRAFLIVDEAHALGVFGPRGAGCCAALGVKPDVLIGAFGKAVGTQGAFVAGSELLRTYLWNRARSFVFSTGTSPALAAVTRDHVEHVQEAEEARRRLWENCELLRAGLKEQGLAVVRDSLGPIVPVLAGSNARALAMAEGLRERGILAQPIRSPTVPAGFERLRITLSSETTREELARLIQGLAEVWRETL